MNIPPPPLNHRSSAVPVTVDHALLLFYENLIRNVTILVKMTNELSKVFILIATELNLKIIVSIQSTWRHLYLSSDHSLSLACSLDQ